MQLDYHQDIRYLSHPLVGAALLKQQHAERTVTELFDSSYSSVVRYAYHACGSSELAEEFAQEAFAALYKELRRGGAVENPWAWILQTVRNHISKHWRFRTRHPEQLSTPDELEALSCSGNPPARIEGDQAKLCDYLGLLTQREEEAILMRAKGMKYREIAVSMGVSTNTVGTLVMRAAQKIRQARNSVPDADGQKTARH